MGLGYDTSSMMSSELETTSFLESDDDASSRITTTTGRATNLHLSKFILVEKQVKILTRYSLLIKFFILIKWTVTVDEEHLDEDVTGKRRLCLERRRSRRLPILVCH